jgi:ABC-2 type transport system ATP-binding protein
MQTGDRVANDIDGPMINIRNLTKRFGGFTAVNNVSLEINPGEIFAFLGTNGAGKTTTIRMMTGVLLPTSGTVEIGGYDIQKNPLEAKMLMGVIPDRPYIYGKLTGREFLSFMADLYRVEKRLAEQRIDELLNVFGLTQWQHELIDGYSHGMKQRLLMCSAQVHNPKILVVDEPMVGLDPRGARLLKDSFRAKADAGLTIFMSTHSLPVAEEIADRLAIIRRGEIVAVGTLEQIKSFSKRGSKDLEDLFLQLIEDEEDSGYR